MATVVYLLLGSNEGDRFFHIHEGKRMLQASVGNIIKQSSLYETAAWGHTQQPDFLNAVVKINTTKTATQLLQSIQQIEAHLGRQRTVHWGQRTLDIDILFFGNQIIQQSDLHIPHPYLHQRRFTLLPLSEIAPGLIHPIFKKRISTLLKECSDPLAVKKL